MKLWLVRHAAVVLPPGICYGASDVAAHLDLTEQAAEQLSSVLPKRVPLRVSALLRAQMLVDSLLTLRGDLSPIVTDARLNEMDFGRWEMTPWADIPKSAFDAWVSDFADHRFGGVESTQCVVRRTAEALADTLETSSASGEAVWVTHAGVIRAVNFLLRHVTKTALEASLWPKHAPEPGGYQLVEIPVDIAQPISANVKHRK